MIYHIYAEVECAKCHSLASSAAPIRADDADAARTVAEFDARDMARASGFKEFHTAPGCSAWLCPACHTPGPAAVTAPAPLTAKAD